MGWGCLKLNADGAIEMKSKVCKEKIPSIEKWTDAFPVYMSIYLTAYPDKAAQLLHYMFVIKEASICQKGFCWHDYDEQFRIARPVILHHCQSLIMTCGGFACKSRRWAQA